MPDFRSSLRLQMLEDVGLSALTGDRIDWGRRLDGSPLPAVCMHVTSDPRPNHFTARQELRESRIQIDVFSDVALAEVVAIAEAIIACIGQPFVSDGVRFEMPQVEGPETSGNQEERIYVHRARLVVLAWHALI